ncbi:nucleotide disphospho-sugar-binding domain-containing protein [Sphingomonas qomolangmaensis]|uniref:Erythromycin biosynthesis protein CIII-like C-terminal domain-containing protein n=1 Tax=Sphingomonas qomolangmaensis TaxID=2918765 RepID=A0ABY5L8W1_9SPHN|nr:nucleotide disphospho-sugar-binding domain-containing protein [Sphingomonas qomolangmaensis]UUL82581.1 hypothetical protein NMP03_15645 [Sphingomonas qomolangmaensis]
MKPFTALARSLISAGGRVVIATNENWRDLVADTGAEFYPISPPDPPQTGRDDLSFFAQQVIPSFRRSFHYLSRLLEQAPHTMVVFRSNMLGAACAVERSGCRSIRILLQPSAVPSFQRPPWPLTALTEGPLGSIGRNAVMPAINFISYLNSPYRQYIDRFRKSIGLSSPIGKSPRASPATDIMLCPEWYALPQSDWPPATILAGFPFDRRPVAASSIAKDAIVFTSGTGTIDGPDFARKSAIVAANVGKRALVLSKSLSHAESHDSMVTTMPFVDLAAVLPGAAAIVHHGGIGTIAEAVRAGVPQLIAAGRFDQPDNAVRIAQLGLGGAILSNRPDPGVISATLLRVLASTHVRSQLRVASDLVKQEDGIAIASEFILGQVAA